MSGLFAFFARVALFGLLRPSLGRAITPYRGERLSGARLQPLQGCKPPALAAVAPPLLFFSATALSCAQPARRFPLGAVARGLPALRAARMTAN